MTTVDLVFDEGPTVGLGHRRRMEALGAALVRRGARVRPRPTGSPPESPSADVTVVDSYSSRVDDGSFGTGPLVAIDDLDRDLEADLVIRPCPVEGEPVVERARRVLRGFEFALLAVPAPPPGTLPDRPDPVVLVTLGGSDGEGRGAQIAAALLGALPEVQVRHAPGPWSLRSSDPSVVTVEAPDGLGDELAIADVVVTAGGVTLLESLALGRATVVVVTADNQVAQAAAADRAGAACVLGGSAATADVVAAVRRLLGDVELRAELGRRGRALVDGHGADRVAEAVLELA